MRVGYLGPEGTFGEEAARASRPEAQLIPCANIEQAAAALLSSDTDLALLPIDNVMAGPVGETLDELYHHHNDVIIADMRVRKVSHVLGGFGTQESVRVVRSRDNTLAQCARFLSRNYPLAEREAVNSTSEAIRALSQSRDKSVAAIGNPRAMERYGVPVLAHSVSDHNDNKMRFVILARRDTGPRAPTGRDATSLIIAPPADRAGLLKDALDIISGDCGLSLMSLNSRPDQQGGLRFYLDIEGHLEDDGVARCVNQLTRRLSADRVGVHHLGSYPRCAFVVPRIKTIGIIGGTGAMGQWLQRTLARAGYDVLVAGRNTDLTYEECVAH